MRVFEKTKNKELRNGVPYIEVCKCKYDSEEAYEEIKFRCPEAFWKNKAISEIQLNRYLIDKQYQKTVDDFCAILEDIEKMKK